MPDIKGPILRPNAGIQQEYSKAILTLVRKMGDEVKKTVRELFEAQAEDMAMDDSPSAQARIALNGLMQKYEPLFNRIAKKATKRMVARTLRNSSVTLGMSLREMAVKLSIKPDLITDQMRELMTAGTNEAVSLIKLIPQKYLGEVQAQVMRSITGGQGLKELVPFLNEKYDGNIRHARNVALDQTRKIHTSLTAGRMEAIGVKEYQWVHTGGSTHPRPLHKQLDGEVFSLDKPPYIGDMYGQKVYGMPGVLPNCRCVLRGIISFEG